MDRELYEQMYTLGERQREVYARVEVGRTAISPWVARLIVLLFVLTIACIPLVRFTVGDASVRNPENVFRTAPAAAAAGWQGDSLLERLLNANAGALRAMGAYERDAAKAVPFRLLVPPLEDFVTPGWLGMSGEHVYLGREGWLFQRQGIDHVTGPGFLTRRHVRRREAAREEWEPELYPDPVAAITGFAEQLKHRGIQLIVVPAPAKPQVHPEMFSQRYDGRRGALHNRSFAQFKAALEAKGVWVFDCADALADAKRRTGRPQYLSTDTHWTPRAVELTAKLLSEFIDDHIDLPPAPSPPYARRETASDQVGDLARMIGRPDRERAVARTVMRASRYLWRPDRNADVLLLGDSFTNIYSLDAMGWGESTGLAEQLGFEMRRPLDRIARNDDGAFATRQMLSRELARGRDRLAGKKLVIWEFAARELSVGNWKPLSMTLGERRPTTFAVPQPGERMTFSGVVHSITPAPRPGTVTYKDHIIAALLVDLTDRKGKPLRSNRALVYLWSMRDGVWTPAARFRAGQRITVRVTAWADVADTYERINRSELDDPDLATEDPCWAEEAND